MPEIVTQKALPICGDHPGQHEGQGKGGKDRGDDPAAERAAGVERSKVAADQEPSETNGIGAEDEGHTDGDADEKSAAEPGTFSVRGPKSKAGKKQSQSHRVGTEAEDRSVTHGEKGKDPDDWSGQAEPE